MNEINNLSELIQNTYLPIMCGPDTVGEYHISSDVANRLAANLVANDVTVRKHSKWNIEVGMNYFKERICPICKKHVESNFWNYCPNCGAKMDLG